MTSISVPAQIAQAAPASRIAASGSRGCGRPGKVRTDGRTEWLCARDAADGSSHSSRISRVGSEPRSAMLPQESCQQESLLLAGLRRKVPSTAASTAVHETVPADRVERRTSACRTSTSRIGMERCPACSTAASSGARPAVDQPIEPAQGLIRNSRSRHSAMPQHAAASNIHCGTSSQRATSACSSAQRKTRLLGLRNRAEDEDRAAVPRMPAVKDLSRLGKMGVTLSICTTSNGRMTALAVCRP